MAQFPLSPRARQAGQSVALGVSVAALAVLAIRLSRWHPHSERATSSSSWAAPSVLKVPAPSLVHDQRLIAVAPEPPLLAVRPVSPATPSAAGLGSSSPVPSAALSSATGTLPFKSASELFAEAKQARVRGDRAAALALSKQIEAIFPNTLEGITTHLSLGVLYLEQGEPSLALEQFKIYRHIGAIEMMAEALWGEEQAYQKLGRTSDERPVLEELLQNFPHSAYAAAAEQRLAALNRGR